MAAQQVEERFSRGQLVSVVDKEGDLREVGIVDEDRDALHRFELRDVGLVLLDEDESGSLQMGTMVIRDGNQLLAVMPETQLYDNLVGKGLEAAQAKIKQKLPNIDWQL